MHINAGAAGLAMAFVLGKRRGWPKENMRGHNIPFVLLGAGLLWFGWFGFNAGSALTASDLASYAWVNTNTATATALLGWIIVEKLRYGKSTALGAASGAVAGLVAITPCAGWVSPVGLDLHRLHRRLHLCLRDRPEEQVRLSTTRSTSSACTSSVAGSARCASASSAPPAPTRSATTASSTAAAAHCGGWNLLLHQVVAAGVVTVFSFVGTFIIALVIGLVIKNRVTEDEELEGLDVAIHGESAYEFGPDRWRRCG